MDIHNDITSGFDKKNTANIDKALKIVSMESKFKPIKIINKSKWWNSEKLGAIHYSGTIDNEPAVLKLQLVKIESPEVELIEQYHAHNRSKHIRPPYIYFHRKWNEEDNFEAIIMEHIEKTPVVNYPAKLSQIDKFHFYYAEYKNNTDVSNPWITKPENLDMEKHLRRQFSKWKGLREKVAKNYEAITNKDDDLIEQGLNILGKVYTNATLEFSHAHFGPQDLFRVSENESVVLSNLYWSWRPRYYDLMFGYHYFKFFLAEQNDMTEQIMEKQILLWEEKLQKTAKDIKDYSEKEFLAAKLERLLAGLNLDYINIDATKPTSNHLLVKTRKDIITTMNNLERYL